MMRRLFGLLAVITFSLFLPPLSAQRLNETINVDLVDLYLTATDSKGFVTNLRKEEIQVYEDGVVQTIEGFTSFAGEKGEIPLSLAFMIDNSGSMVEDVEGVWKIDMAREAGIMLVDELGPLDRMMVVTFDEKPEFTALTQDRSLLLKGINAVRVRFGATALFDSLITIMEQFNREVGRKILVLCSDGNDNLSKHKIEEVIQKMVDSPDLSALVLGTVATTVPKSSYDKIYFSDEGRQILQRMADNTGGYAFFPKSMKEVSRVQKLIRNFIRSQYSVAYRSTNTKMDGSWRTIKITSQRKGVNLRYRKGYHAR